MLYIIWGLLVHMFYFTKRTTPMSNEVTCNKNNYKTPALYFKSKGRRGHDRMVVGFTTTYAISAYHN